MRNESCSLNEPAIMSNTGTAENRTERNENPAFAKYVRASKDMPYQMAKPTPTFFNVSRAVESQNPFKAFLQQQ